MKTVLSVVVGSRLHKLNNENSDYDIRGIFMHSLKEILSPFKKQKNTSWVEGDEDNTAHELREFCKYATKGNATILEILWSNMVRENTPIGEELQANRQKFLDSHYIYDAHKGYAESQYRKMNLFTPDARTPKFAIAYLRVLEQGKQLIETGDFNPIVTKNRDFLLDVKYNWRNELIPELSKRFTIAQFELAESLNKTGYKFKPDFDWIEDFILRSYETN
jgi:hypothetical protein